MRQTRLDVRAIVTQHPLCPRCGQEMSYQYLGDRCYAGPICASCHILANGESIVEIPDEHWDRQGNCTLNIIHPFVHERLGWYDDELGAYRGPGVG